MDWNRRNSNGAVAHPNNLQYLPQSTSSTVPTMVSHATCVQPNSYTSAQAFVANSRNNRILKGLLGATTNEEILKLQRTALLKPPGQQQATQVSPGQYNSSYNLMNKMPTTTSHQSGANVQNPVVSNYQTQVYSNPILQSLQQGQPLTIVQQQGQPLTIVQQPTQSLTIVQQQGQPVQCYGTNGTMQQSQQSIPNSGYSQKRRMTNNYPAKRLAYQPMVPKPNLINSMPNGSSGPYVASYKANDKNVPVSTSGYQNGQNVPSQMTSSYQAMPHTNTLQTQSNVNEYVQILQRQAVPSGFANNSSTVLPSASVGHMPPSYTQSSVNTSNVNNASANQVFSNPSQSFVAQNVQQPVPSYTMPHEQQSTAAPPPAYSGNDQQRNNAREILALLQVYRNVKQKYLLLNRENNLLRQKMQSSSQDKPPLISTLQNCAVQANDPMGRQDTSQNLTAQNQTLSNTTNAVVLYDNSMNVEVQNMAQPSNSFSTQVYPTNNFDSGQMGLGGGANSSGQATGSETLQGTDSRNTSMVSIQANNQYFGGNSTNIYPKMDYIAQDGLNITSAQNLAQRTTENYNPDQTTNSSNFYSKSSSREAIKATLSLWKMVPQSSAQNKSGYQEPNPKLHVQDNRLDTIHMLDEIAPSSKNEPPSVTLTQKSEHSAPNVAIVSPLVQMKDLVNVINQRPKGVPQGKELVNNGVNGLKENECFNELLQAIKSVDAATSNASMNKLQDLQNGSNMVSSLSSNIEQNSTDIVDENLQISGICTLVEGNSFYDSSIAMMFEGSLQAQDGSPLATAPEDARTLQCSREDASICDASQATIESPTEKMAAVKSEPQGELMSCENMEGDKNQSGVYCLELQPEENLSASDAFDSESTTVSDQLSELLTEFPFGFINYMSENKVERTAVSSGRLEEKPETLKTQASFSCDGGSDALMKDVKKEDALDMPSEEMESKETEVIDQSVSKTVSLPTDEVPTDEATSFQLEDDGFEICDTPDDSIHITLLDQDQIPKLFPEESAEPEESTEPVEQADESPVENSTKESEAPVEDVPVSPIKEGSDNEKASVSDKQLFCCLFSWLTHTNGSAPKCNCKLTDLVGSEDLPDNVSQLSPVIKTEPLTESPDPSTDVLDPSTDGLDPSFPVPCKSELDIKSNKILPPVIKHPTLETEIHPAPTEREDKSGPSAVDCGPQEEMRAKLDWSEKNLEDESQKEWRTNERTFQSTSPLEDPNSKNSENSFGYKSKVDGTRKLEKLIIKTDFLKNKHVLKMKRKYKEIKYSESVVKNSQNGRNIEVGESAKMQNVHRISEGKTNNEPYKVPTSMAPQSVSSVNKLKSTSGSDKSHSRSQTPSGRKRKERVKIRPESHFEKVKRVPTVQEYLERKRELCNKRSGPKADQRDGQAEVRPGILENTLVEKSGGGGLLCNLPTASKYGKPNTKPKNIQSEATYHSPKGQVRNGGHFEPYRKKHRGGSGSHGRGSFVDRNLDQKTSSSRDKIYLSPCDSINSSCEGISLTKLQIIRSPEKLGYFDRRQSLDSSVSSKKSKPEIGNKDTPKMLEFKLCPEFISRSPSSHEKKETKTAKEKSVVEGIKSKKEAWCSGGPMKKTRVDGGSEDQGRHSPSQSTFPFKPTPNTSARPVQDSQSTFNVFKQKYQELRSRSLDSTL